MNIPRLRRGRAAFALVGLALVVIALLATRVRHSLAATPVGTIEATKGTFVREVEAEGVLKAVRATPIVAPMEQERAQKVAYVAKDGAAVVAGEVVVRFDPLEAEREAMDGRDDLRSAQGKIARAKAEDGKTRDSLALDQKLAREELDRSRTFELTDSDLYSRHQIVESTLDRALQEQKSLGHRRTPGGERQARGSGPHPGWHRSGQGGIAPPPGREEPARAHRDRAARWLLRPGAGMDGGNRARRRDPVAGPEGRGHSRPERARRPGARARGRLRGPAARSPCRIIIEGRPGEVHGAKVASVQPVARPRDRGSPVKFFETTVSLDRTLPGS